MTRYSFYAFLTISVLAFSLHADEEQLKRHCSKCHSDEKAEGGFRLSNLGESATQANLDAWTQSLDYVRSGEMPPDGEGDLSESDRAKLVSFFQDSIALYSRTAPRSRRLVPRRLNNRELLNSVRDVLLIEDIGTNEPGAKLLADTLSDGFDTNGEALGLSEYHLEQYLNAFRKILDATILSGHQPESRNTKVLTKDLRLIDQSNQKRPEKANRVEGVSIEILDLRQRVYFSNFDTVPETGRYRIKLRAMAVDRNVYSADKTGHYEGDPIRIRVHLGDRNRDFDLTDNEIETLELDEWLAKGSTLRISYLTDALRLQGNGNFKFQYRIAHDYIKKNDPELYQKVVTEEVPKSRFRRTNPAHWVHWTSYWQGPRPRLFDAEVEGPIYDSWPPERQVRLIGTDPQPERAIEILKPIAERAWRRRVSNKQLEPIARLVRIQAQKIGNIEAFKEGILAILASPSFLLINSNQEDDLGRFATKLSYFLNSTIPEQSLQKAVANGELANFESVVAMLKRNLQDNKTPEFVREFPKAWLELDRINFMAPDPDQFPLYEKKQISEDMVNEVLHFFEHGIRNNVTVPELLTADYSFVNADLAKIYGLNDLPSDSKFRKYHFRDGRRGGFLGMGAFLTLTADSLGTSPIHRAVYVMENFLGLHPTPPPADVEIEEPDVRQAKTIKEVLKAHTSDASCASCHQTIDPYGYAFENFDPVGAWRESYTTHLSGGGRKRNNKSSLDPIPIDAAAKFRNGSEYNDIIEFRELMKSDLNRDRFVRCFIKKLLVYANGQKPDDYIEVEKILAQSAKHDYRIIETIAAVINSPLFRETN